MNFATILGGTLSWATLAGQIFVILIIISLLFFKNNKVILYTKKYGMLFAFIVVLTSILGSLAYSDILGYEPCKLCWYQRILMYPQIVILGLGMYMRDRNAALSALALSLLGMCVSWYHYLMQLGFVPAGCDVVGYSVSCAKVFTMHLGYITIPLMAFTAFVMSSVFLVVYRIGGEEK